jgi:hypothetical protein
MDSSSSNEYDWNEPIDETSKELPNYYISQTYLLDKWESVKKAINEANIKTIVMKLYYNDEVGFINTINMPNFLTIPEPIIVGFNTDAKTPFMIIRFVDTKHNNEAKIPPGALSFLVITIRHVPYCGFEQFMEEINFIKNEEFGGYKLKTRWEHNCDGGEAITDYVVKLIIGYFDDKKIK